MKNGQNKDKHGNIYWYLNEKLHREDGPAIEWKNGSKDWIINGKRHRIDGPAVEGTNGTTKWYLNGKLHRDDGPAIHFANGTDEWYLNGVHLTEEEFNHFCQWLENRINERMKSIHGPSYK